MKTLEILFIVTTLVFSTSWLCGQTYRCESFEKTPRENGELLNPPSLTKTKLFLFGIISFVIFLISDSITF